MRIISSPRRRFNCKTRRIIPLLIILRARSFMSIMPKMDRIVFWQIRYGPINRWCLWMDFSMLILSILSATDRTAHNKNLLLTWNEPQPRSLGPPGNLFSKSDLNPRKWTRLSASWIWNWLTHTSGLQSTFAGAYKGGKPGDINHLIEVMAEDIIKAVR